MKKHFFDFLKKQKSEAENSVPTKMGDTENPEASPYLQNADTVAEDPFDTDFMNSISFEENPLEDEIPDSVQFFDKHGNEVPRP